MILQANMLFPDVKLMINDDLDFNCNGFWLYIIENSTKSGLNSKDLIFTGSHSGDRFPGWLI